jgi:hypothetical protein
MIRIFTAGTIVLGLAATGGAAASAQQQPSSDVATIQSQPARSVEDAKIICKYVVAAGPSRENKPYRMCMSKSDWAMKDARDAKDPNRIVCKYQEDPSAPKLWGYKICQPASEWAEQERMEREHIQRIQMGTCAPGQPC